MKFKQFLEAFYHMDDVAIGGTVIYKTPEHRYGMSKAVSKVGPFGIKLLNGSIIQNNAIVSTDASDWAKYKDATYTEETNEGIRGWKHAGRDLMKFRKEKMNAAKAITLVRLNKDGSESKMHDAIMKFNDETEARAYHDRIMKNNPGKAIKHALKVDDKVEVLEGKS